MTRIGSALVPVLSVVLYSLLSSVHGGSGGVKCPLNLTEECLCSQAGDSQFGGWDLDCSIHRIEYSVKKFVSFECTGYESCEAPYEEALFEKLDITDVETFKFKYCPLPANITYKELLRGMSVLSLKVELCGHNHSIQGHVFSGLEQLEELNLRRSNLQDIDSDAFVNLTTLKRLFLEDNELTRLNEGLFEGLTALSTLQLANNKLESLPGAIFYNLTNLQRLYLYSNRLRELPEGLFEGLEALQVLDLGNNRIATLQPEMFRGASKLVHLNLKGNSLRQIHGEALASLVNLRELDLSDNQNITSLPGDLLFNLTKLKIFKMNSCKITGLPGEFFEQAKNLTNVTLYNNRIASLEPNLFLNNTYLEEIDLKYNNLTELPHNLFTTNSKLKRLVLSVNRIGTIPEDLFDQTQSLTILQLSSNELQVLHGDWFNFVQLEELDVKNNKIAILNGSQPFGRSNNLKTVDLSFNALTEVPPGLNWIYYLKLTKVNLTGNKIRFLDVPNVISEMTIIDLKGNEIESIDVEDILLAEDAQKRFLQKVQVRAEYNLEGNRLNCDCRLWNFVKYIQDYSNNHFAKFSDAGSLRCHAPDTLRDVPLIDVNPERFACNIDNTDCPPTCNCEFRAVDRARSIQCRNLTDLPSIIPFNTTEVYLQDNEIGNLIALEEQPMWENITVLYLDNNNLTAEEIQLPPNLKVLSLKGNHLEYLPESVSGYVQGKRDLKLFLSDNPWFCDCSTLKFKDWLHENAKKVMDVDGIVCDNTVYQNGTNYKPLVIRLTDELCPDENEIDNAKLITVSIICVILALLLFVVSVLYYRNKQTLTAYVYIHFYKVFVCFFNEEEFDEDKTFDAFISYSTADRDVAMALIGQLEQGDPAFKLCIHERDWLPGNLISWNIVNSVQNSRKTILVLSKDFLESVWFQVEFHTAYYQMLEDRIDRLIVIVKGDLPAKDTLDKDLQFLLSTKTYLEWGERWFWEKLRFALPHHRELDSEKMALRQRPNKSLLKTVEQRIAALTASEGQESKDKGNNNRTSNNVVQLVTLDEKVRRNNDHNRTRRELPPTPPGTETINQEQTGNVNNAFVLSS